MSVSVVPWGSEHKKPVHVAVTGASGSIAYPLVFNIASGQMLGPDQPVILHLQESREKETVKGLAMELEDIAEPLLKDIVVTRDLDTLFRDVKYALLIGAKPRGKGMERKDLLEQNAEIFVEQGRALNAQADQDVRIVVVGNPANTNALILKENAPDIDPRHITALMRLDHNRAKGMLSKNLDVAVNALTGVTVWGNHSPKQFPDYHYVQLEGKPLGSRLQEEWYRSVAIPAIQKRGSCIIEARGASSAASAAKATIDHMHDWALGTPENDWTSMGVVSDGSYGIEEGLVYGYPVKCRDGEWEIVQGLEVNTFSRGCMNISEKELQEEYEAVQAFLPQLAAA